MATQPKSRERRLADPHFNARPGGVHQKAPTERAGARGGARLPRGVRNPQLAHPTASYSTPEQAPVRSLDQPAKGRACLMKISGVPVLYLSSTFHSTSIAYQSLLSP